MTTDVTAGIIQSTFDIGRMMRAKMMSSAPNGMHMGQIQALLFIHEHKGVTMTELAQMLHVKSPTATSFVSRLHRMKLVTRSHDAKNRKLVRLSLTIKGQRMLKEKFAERKKMVASLLNALSVKEQVQFLKLLHTILSRSNNR